MAFKSQNIPNIVIIIIIMYMWCLKRQNHFDHNSLKIVIIAVTKACILRECQLFGKNIKLFLISEKSPPLSFKYAAKEPLLQMVYLPLVLLQCHCVISYIAFWPLSGRAFCICRILVFAFTQGDAKLRILREGVVK